MKTIKIFFGKNKGKNVFHIPSLTGYIEFTQESREQSVVFTIYLEGLTPNKLHGFHIHENPVTGEGDLKKKCDSCGGHFNPTGTEHGSYYNKVGERHIGDLINNLKADSKGICQLIFTDKYISLYKRPGPQRYCVLGKSIVIHQDTDDLGREGLQDNLPYLIYDFSLNKNVIVNSNIKTISQGDKYKSVKKRESSKQNGNAGGRIACANIEK